jgi:DNA-binding XRE family transcriptional regulator
VIKQQLGLRISGFRRAIPMSQEKLAELSEYSTDFIGLAERGVNAPSVEGCDRIAKALSLEVRDLFAFDESLPSPPAKKKKSVIKRPRGRPRMHP